MAPFELYEWKRPLPMWSIYRWEGERCRWIAEFESGKTAKRIMSELTQAALKATASKERSKHMKFPIKTAKPAAKAAAKPAAKPAKPCKGKSC